MISPAPLTRPLYEASLRDAYRGLLRLDPDDMQALGLHSGDVVVLAEGRTPKVALRVLPSLPDARGKGAGLDGVERQNLGVSLGANVHIWPVTPAAALRVELEPLQDSLNPQDLRAALLDRPLMAGNQLKLELYGKQALAFQVKSTQPEGAVIVTAATQIALLQGNNAKGGAAPLVGYDDIGGLTKELSRVRELVELPLKYPEIFRRLGVEPPRGILLYGPPGTGKTLIARAVAREAGAHFISVAGPEIVGKYYGESEKRLRDIFAEGKKRTPSVIFLDEIDAIGPKRSEVQGEVEKRVVAQLLSLMDGLDSRGQVLVIAATNRPDSLDPALRRPGRFDREVTIGAPDRESRLEILHVHTRSMPLAGDVDLRDLAERTYGFVGADLAALCREAALERLRDALPDLAYADTLPELTVRAADFEEALKQVVPSAMRELTAEVPAARWEDVGGLTRIKRRLRELIELPLEHPEAFKRLRLEPPRGILLAGPPGTGKTLVARAVAHEVAANFILVRGAQLLSKYVGESERALRELFARARQNAPAILFFDEIDSFLSNRDSGDTVGERVIGQFLAEMDGALAVPGVTVLGATNRPDALDPALRRSGRFETVLHFGLPDRGEREAILRIHLQGRSHDPSSLPDLAARSDGFTGADLERLSRRAAMRALERSIETGDDAAISNADLQAALAEILEDRT